MSGEDDKPHVRISGDVMGMPVEARSDGRVGIDEEVLRDRVEHGIELRVQYWIESCATQVMLAIFFAGLFSCISVFCGYATWRQITGDPILGQPIALPAPASAASGPVATSWDGADTLSCGGSKQWRIEGTTARLPGKEAVVVAGHCELTLIDVTLDAETGIKAGGHAVVTVIGGSITGSKAAVRTGGDAVVTLRGVEVVGEREMSASSRIVEE